MNRIKINRSIKTNWIFLLALIIGLGKLMSIQSIQVEARTVEVIQSPILTETLNKHEGLNATASIQPLEAALAQIPEPQAEVIPLTQEFPVCSTSESKSYMFYQDINEVSAQMDLIRSKMITRFDGLLSDEDGYLGVALGSAFGPLGTRYIFILDSGIELPVIKIEEKADQDTINGCQHQIDESVLEFVLDSTIAPYWFGVSQNGYINSGNFNNHPDFQGSIIQIQKVLD